MSGGLYDAATMERWNVVNRVLPDDQLLEKGMRFAQRLAEGATVAHAATKRIIRAYRAGGVDEADRVTPEQFAELFASEDLQGAVKSFISDGPGKATFKGVEVETVATLYRDVSAGRRLNFTGTLGYLDAQFDEYVTNIANFDANGNPAPTSAAQPIDVADFRRIQNTPKWTTSATLDYTTPVGNGEIFASTTWSYRSKTYQFELPSP